VDGGGIIDPRSTSTQELAIGGGRGFPQADQHTAYLDRFATSFGLPRPRASVLLDRYGTLARKIAAFCQEAADAPLRTLPSYTRRELMFIAENELVRRLSDVLYRRTTIALSGAMTPTVVQEVANIIGGTLGWDEREAARQAQDAWREGQERHNLRDQFPLSSEPLETLKA